MKETSRIEPDPAANAGTEHSRTCAEARSEEPSESASKIDLQGELLARSLKDQEEHLLLKRILQTRRLDEEDSSKELQTIRRHARAARKPRNLRKSATERSSFEPIVDSPGSNEALDCLLTSLIIGSGLDWNNDERLRSIVMKRT